MLFAYLRFMHLFEIYTYKERVRDKRGEKETEKGERERIRERERWR